MSGPNTSWEGGGVASYEPPLGGWRGGSSFRLENWKWRSASLWRLLHCGYHLHTCSCSCSVNFHAHAHVHANDHAHVLVHAHAHAHFHARVHVHVHVYVHVHVHVHVHVQVHAHMPMFMLLFMFMLMCDFVTLISKEKLLDMYLDKDKGTDTGTTRT